MNPTSDPAVALVVAEALVESNQGARAAVVLRELAADDIATEARRGLARLGAAGGRAHAARVAGRGRRRHGGGGPRGDARSSPRRSRGRGAGTPCSPRSRPGRRTGRSRGRPRSTPPRWSPRRRGAAGDGARLETAALRRRGAAGRPAAGAGARRASPTPRGGAELGERPSSSRPSVWPARPRFVRSPRSSSTRAARAGPAAGDGGGGARRRAGGRRCADPTCLPAALALRREVARRGDVRPRSTRPRSRRGGCSCPAHRVRALLLAAALAEEAARRARARARGGDCPSPAAPRSARGARWACCARRWRSIRRTTAPSSGCARC